MMTLMPRFAAFSFFVLASFQAPSRNAGTFVFPHDDAGPVVHCLSNRA